MAGFGKDGKGVIIKEDISQVLGTLAGGAAIIVATSKATFQSAFRMLKSEITAQITGMTGGESDGTLMLGIANGGLSVAEIEAAIELNGPLSRSDRVNNELAMRPVWYIGRFSGPGFSATRQHLDGVYKRAWTFGETDGWNLFVHNVGATALTTGSTARIKATHFGVWVGE